MAQVKFEKRVGGWSFDIKGRSFLAVRNIAGFAHRDWEVWTLEGSVQGVLVDDQLSSRAECVEMAENYLRNVTVPPYSSAQQMYWALQVIAKDPRISMWLGDNDPKAMQQVLAAIVAYETGTPS